MKICILTGGSHGDIRPYVALGVGLRSRGYEVRFASHQSAYALCKQYGLEFKLIEGDITEWIGTLKGDALFSSVGGNKITLFWEMIRMFKSVMNSQLTTSLDAAQGMDAIIYSPIIFAGPHLSEYYKVPSVRLLMQPEFKTREHPSMIFPNFGKTWNTISHLITEQIFWQSIRGTINRWRKKTLHLDKLHFLGPTFDTRTKSTPSLIAFSPKVMPQPTDWPPYVRMTNFLRLGEGTSWEPPAPLQDFLNSGPAPLYLGFGSLTKACPKSAVPQIVEVLKEKKIRTIIQSQLPGLDVTNLPSHFFPIHYAPHDWLFPRMRAVIHHGGAGTTASGLYAGKPTLIFPFMADQFIWNQRISELGVGPLGHSIKKFNKNTFSKCLEDLLNNPNYPINAQKISQDLYTEEDGVSLTIKAIEGYFL